MVRENLIDLARSQIGYAEPTGDDQYIKWYNQQTKAGLALSVPWCCVFVSWVFDRLGVVKLVKPFASCTQMTNWFKGQGRFKARGTYTPVPGDIVMYDWDKSGDSDHVGIVESVKGDTLTVIEGNYNDAVRRRTTSLNNAQIRGYCIPDFPTGDVNGDGKVDAKDAQAVLKAAVGKTKLTEKQKHNADVNLDGKVDAKDARAILKEAVR